MNNKLEDILTSENKKLSLGKDLVYSLPYLLIGYMVGNISSYIYPGTLPRVVKDIRDGGIKDLANFLGSVALLTGYAEGVHQIIKNLHDNYDKPIAYLPLALNAMTGLGELAYKYGKGHSIVDNLKEKMLTIKRLVD